MGTVVGLGEAGCNIAKLFSQYPQYEAFYIDAESKKEDNYLKITKQDNHELYESKTRLRKAFFEKIKGPVIFILSGSGDISGACLRVLEKLKNLDLYVLYIKPDTDLLSETKLKQEKVVFHVLQQYARSGLLKRMFIVSNPVVESVLGDVPVIGYHEKLNNLIVPTMHMINVYSNIKPEMSTFSEPVETARISTFGFADIETGEEKLFYDLKMPREKIFYYAINEEELQSSGGLYKKITTQLKEKSESENVKVSYGIYSTQYEQNYVYCVAHATLVQEENL
tara:strand:+ start:2699 stop:3541 length:843 start_codon:yes stop_codon:yes gene_type:complete